MNRAGRPFRFLALVVGSWAGVRGFMLWPEPVPLTVVPLMPEAVATPRHASDKPQPMPVAAISTASVEAPRLAFAQPGRLPAVPGVLGGRLVVPLSPRPAEAPAQQPFRTSVVSPVPVVAPALSAPGEHPRWSGSIWAIARGDGQHSALPTPQLGGSQIGLRIARTLDRQGRWAAVARGALAPSAGQADVALGVEWRPGKLPLRVVAEQRVGLAKALGGAALGVIGGVSEARLAKGVALDSYAQAGVIARDGGEGYADGAVRLGTRVAALDLGLGAWGAAQRGAARLDVGPSVGTAIAVGRQRLRLTLDWRERVAGNARPASGLALSLGADF